MGYSIAVPMKSKKAQTEMLKFLEEHYRPWSEISKGTEHETPYTHDCTYHIRTDEEISYAGGRCRIGFDYGPSFVDREYAFYILYWIALRAGRKGKGKARINYDGCETWYLSFGDEDWCIKVDEHGFHPQRRSWESWEGGISKALAEGASWLLGESKRLDETDEIMHNELKRLSGCWDKHVEVPDA